MVNYANGKIYKIVSQQTQGVYIGSTCKKYLSERMMAHKSAYKNRDGGKMNKYTAYEILQFDDAKIILVELYPCVSKDELLAREQHWIDKIDCVNKANARGLDPIKANLRAKNWRNNHKEKLHVKIQCPCGSEYVKHHEIDHKKTAKHKLFLETGELVEKENVNDVHVCGCGGTFTNNHKMRHLKTTMHTNYIKSEEYIPVKSMF